MPENPTNANTVYILNATSVFHDVLFNSIVNAAPGAVKIPYIVFGAAMNQAIGIGIGNNTSPQLNAVLSNVGLVTSVVGLGVGLIPGVPAVAAGLVVAGIGFAVSTALTLAYDISSSFRSDFDNYVDDALVAVGDAAEWVGDIYRDLANFVENLPSDIEAAKDAIADHIENRFEDLKNTLKETYNDIGNALDNALVDLGQFLDSVEDITRDIMNGNFSGVSESILDYLDNLFGSPGDATPVSDALASAGQWFGDSLHSPLVFDLGGQGLDLLPLSGSPTFFDFDGDLFKEQTGWAANDNAIDATPVGCMLTA